MKKRLFGLIALVLCLMLTGMPAALADFLALNNDGTISANIYQGYLIEGGTKIGADTSAAECYLYYGLPSSYEPDKVVVISPESDPISMDGSRNYFWHTWYADYDQMWVETAGRPVMSRPYYSDEEGVQVFVFDHPLVGTDYNGSYFPVGFAVSTFEHWVAENAPGASMKMYDAAVYGEVADGVWAPYDELPGSEDFYLPGVNGDVVAVLHWAHNEYLQEILDYENEVTPNGILIEHLQECSPFAVVYNPAPAPAAPPSSGDSSPLVLWFALAGISLAGALLTFRRRRSA